jgi:sigma-B regulation protein RsbU (phosphoserine phosphatase)
MNRHLKNLTWVVAVLTAVWFVGKFSLSGLQLAESRQYGLIRTAITTKIIASQKSGKINFNVTDDTGTDSLAIVSSSRAADYLEAVYPEAEDTIVTINGRPATAKRWKSEVDTLHRAGDVMAITYQHHGEEKAATLVFKALSDNYYALMWGFQIFAALVCLLYILIGFFTISKQGDMAQARVLALFILSLSMLVGMSLFGVIRELTGVAATLNHTLLETIISKIGILAGFATGYWLHLAFIFPFTSPLLEKKPWLAYVLCYTPAVLALPFALGLHLGAVESAITGLCGFAKFVQAVAAVVILFRKRRRTRTMIEKRQLKAVLWGILLGPVVFLVPLIALIVYLAVSQRDDIAESVAIGGFLLTMCLALLPIPISYLYAFRKYRLMEVELKLRRGTRFAIVTGALLLVFFGVLFAVTGLLLNILAVNGQTVGLIVAMMALGFTPVHRRTQRLVERKFFPERNKLRSMLNEVIAAAASMPDRVALWDRLEAGLKEGMNIAAAIPVLTDEDGVRFVLPNGDAVPVDAGGGFLAELRGSTRPVFVDEAIATGRVSFSEAEQQWLKEQRVAVAIPMIIHSQLIGFLALSFSSAHEELSAEDLSVLLSVVSQVALQSENLRLLEENLDKRRMQEQLAMARDVQQRFLPHDLPDTPGLNVTARFRSSLEVAGDYYDVLPLGDGRTLLALGDVSGKGAGAAMIMANVQASMRSMARAGVSLETIVTGINELLCANTLPEQFVTFFTAIYSPDTRSFTSINAGHNPPRLLHANGTVTALTEGGPILAVIPFARYDSQTVTVEKGDVLVAFTDGVSEAMNDRDEEFGEDHIADVCRPVISRSANVITETIEEAVGTFCGSRPLGDDFTLLVAKVL